MIRFDGVSKHYPDGTVAVDHLSLEAPTGQITVLVGPSGCGKTTSLRMVNRMIEPTGGRILVDGQDIGQVSPGSVRQAIGVVPQDTALFNDTIGSNIAYGRIGCTSDDVIAACKAAQLHDLIMSLPEQYDTPVGERGVKISGGEKQRIAIARAILKSPPILIFDEATSALDSDSEHAIAQELDRLSRNRTTLIIAHRLSTIVNANAIIVMDRGRIVERGSHAELLRRKGVYARLWLLQQRMDEDMRRASTQGE
jgi:ATP-binding cassette subfamily B protein